MQRIGVQVHLPRRFQCEQVLHDVSVAVMARQIQRKPGAPVHILGMIP